jgi:hypothetical protein
VRGGYLMTLRTSPSNFATVFLPSLFLPLVLVVFFFPLHRFVRQLLIYSIMLSAKFQLSDDSHLASVVYTDFCRDARKDAKEKGFRRG